MDSNKIAEIFRKHPQWADVKKICSKLKENGFTAWLAGGCVRDGLLGITPKDFDVATNARPKKIESLFNKTVDVGKAFGVIRVVEPAGDIEVATFRKDGIYLDGRRPQTVELSTPEEDAKRRDFTINGLFFDPFENRIHDFVGGVADIQKKLIRTVGIAADRFMEDKLRVMRAIRFVSQLDFELDPLTFGAVCHHAPAITQVSAERVTDEMTKLFKGRRPDKGVELLHHSGLLQIIFPEIRYEKESGVFFGKIPDEPFQADLGWLGLFKLMTDSTLHRQIARRMKFSGAMTETIVDAIELVTSLQIFDRLTLAERKKRAAEPQAPLALRYLELTAGVPKEVATFISQNRSLPSRHIEAADLMAIGIQPGKELGVLLEKIYDAQLEGKVKNRGEALQFAKNLAQKSDT